MANLDGSLDALINQAMGRWINLFQKNHNNIWLIHYSAFSAAKAM